MGGIGNRLLLVVPRSATEHNPWGAQASDAQQLLLLRLPLLFRLPFLCLLADHPGESNR